MYREKCCCFSFCVCVNSTTSSTQWKIFASFPSSVHLKPLVAPAQPLLLEELLKKQCHHSDVSASDIFLGHTLPIGEPVCDF